MNDETTVAITFLGTVGGLLLGLLLGNLFPLRRCPQCREAQKREAGRQ